MIPILYPATETQFTSGGICRLVDAIKCTVPEDTNWTYTLEMEYPINGRYFSELKINRVILAEPAPGQTTQPFDIYDITVDISGVATIYARHAYNRLARHIGTMYDGAMGYDNLMARYISGSAGYTEESSFLFWVAGCSGISGTVYKKNQVLTGMDMLKNHKSIIAASSNGSQYGASNVDLEYSFDRFFIRGYNTTAGYSRGKANPTIITVGRNLTGINYELDYGEAKRCILPFYRVITNSDEKGFEDADIYYITDSLEAYSYVDESGNIVNVDGETSPYASRIIDVVEREPTDNLNYGAFPLDLTSEFKHRPGPSALFAAAMKYADQNNIAAPYVNLTIDYTQIDPAQEPEYTFPPDDPILLCDTCTVQFTDIGLTAQMKVVKCVYDVLRGQYSQLEFGSLQRTIYTQGSNAGTGFIDESAFPIADIDVDDGSDVVPDEGDEDTIIIDD